MSSRRSTSGPPVFIEANCFCHGDFPDCEYRRRLSVKRHDRITSIATVTDEVMTGRRAGMELVRAASLTGYFAVAEELGLDVVPLLRRAGICPFDAEQSRTDAFPPRSAVRLLEDSAEASSCVTFGLRMAEHRQISDIGMVSLLIVHQPTLSEALEVLGEFRTRINSNLTLADREFRGYGLPARTFRAESAVGIEAGERCRSRRALQDLPDDDGRGLAAPMRVLQLRTPVAAGKSDLRAALRLSASVWR